MLSRIAKLLLALALTSSIGLHWFVFQTVAWTSMLADNLRHDSLSEAVFHTFDGQHPCVFCKAISSQKKSEKKSESSPLLKSLEFPAPATDSFYLACGVTSGPALNTFALVRAAAPPSPPPRSLVPAV